MKMMLLLLLGIYSAQPDVASLRKLFYQAAENEGSSKELSKLLKAVNEDSEPVLLCYKGASYMMEAKYVFNPFTKLSRFNKGKKAIEQAIAKDPKQPEMRFIRFAIQVNLPSFLGYKDNIQSDKGMLLNGFATIEDKVLKENVRAYLIASKKCTNEELKKLQQ